MNSKEIVSELKRNAVPADREGMARFGINSEHALGIRIPVLRKIAKKTGRNHALAAELWATGIHEVRILASMVDEPEKVTEKQMDSWIKEFNSWDICDQCCMNLFDKTSIAFEKAIKLTNAKQEFVKRTGFALMACLAWHHKTASDKEFQKFFLVIKKHSTDQRNFVKKAINWALRQIGKRNNNLKQQAVTTAKDILKQHPDSKAAKWVANDALKELTNRMI